MSDNGRRWRNQPVVRERDGNASLRVGGALFGVILALLPWGTFLVHRNACMKVDYEVDRLRTEQETLKKEERRLLARRADLSSLQRIERWAQREGGLIAPPDDNVVVLGEPLSRTEQLLARGDDAGRVSAR